MTADINDAEVLDEELTGPWTSVPSFSLGTRHCRRVYTNTSKSSESEILIDLTDLYVKHADYKHAVHCFVWAPWPHGKVINNRYSTRAAILMQNRFDGSLGFAGGLVDVMTTATKTITVDDIVDALNRELHEEINLNADKYLVTRNDHLFTDVDDVHKLFLHFYTLKVTEKEIREIERDALLATDFADEVFGTTRVPLYTMSDGFRGFPIFLSNTFVGNSKGQLLNALRMLDIMTDEEITTALNIKREFINGLQHKNPSQ